MGGACNRRFTRSSRSCRMITCRTSLAALVFALVASVASAQGDDRATAPPHPLSGASSQSPDVDTSDLKSDEAGSDQPPPSPHKVRPADDGRDVSTDDLKADDDETPPPATRQTDAPAVAPAD